MADLEKLANILGAETIKRIYEDGLSGTVQETGKMLTDLAKTLRLFTLPFQVGADIQERVTKRLMKVRDSVPEENQIPAPASLAVPLIERIKYLEDENYLTDLYLNLLSRAIDKDRVNEAHPAFFHIIDQLSPDEAYLLLKIKEIGKLAYFAGDRFPISTETEELSLDFPENNAMYFSHLRSLNLLSVSDYDNKFFLPDGARKENYNWYLRFSDFGELFAKACIPDKGFNVGNKS
jgi:hypothetical protein